jgi:hypothetical protein
MSLKELIEEANKKAVENMMEAEPVLVDVKLAKDFIPGFKSDMILHAGPPITWERMSGPLKGAVIGALMYEGLADTLEQAEKMASRGDIVFKPNHEFGGACPMAGVVTPNMPIYIIHDKKFGNYAYSNFNEGIGKVLRYGAYDKEVMDRLKWMHDELFPALKAALQEAVKDKGGIAIKPLIAQGLHMGDEGHNRYIAITRLFLIEITPYLIQADLPKDVFMRVYTFAKNNNFFALNIGMAAAKAMTMAAHNIKYSTIVSVLTRNGTDAGIWVSGLGNRWFTAPAPVPKGVFFPGFTQDDANPDIGDSSITETAGFGGFAMAAAPAIVSWVGGSVQFAVENTKKMYQITYTKHKYFTIPYLEFQGTPTGIDIRYVLKTGITPTINTGIAHKKPGVGQVGAGIVSFPFELFKNAFKAFVETYGA